MKNLIMGIYIITCSPTAKVYIGSSINIQKRWKNHRTYLNTNRHQNEHLQAAWNKYGREYFTFGMLEVVENKEDLIRKEERWVIKYNSIDREKGFNKCIPGKYEGRGKPESYIRTKDYRIVCLKEDGEKEVFENCPTAASNLNLDKDRIHECLGYWNIGPKRVRRSYKGYMFIRYSEYKEELDYNRYFRPRKPRSKSTKLLREKIKKDPIPIRERKLDRRGVILIDKTTREEIYFPCISWAIQDLGLCKSIAMRCLKKPFMQRSHGGYWMKYND